MIKIPTHTFSPSTIGLPYAQAINKEMKPPGLWIREHDVDMGPASTERFLSYISKMPDKIHVSPYLIREPLKDGRSGLIWVNRKLETRNADSLPDRVRKKIVNYLPSSGKPIKVILSVSVPIQGGEPETEMWGLGSTYIPYMLWQRIVTQVIDVNWIMLDTRICEACLRQGYQGIVHWDCVSSHSHIQKPDLSRDNFV